ncbi:MAG: hypothetical protein R3F61_06410 [Myxococcota bacterium]
MLALLVSSALAKSWCADPLIAHEWGVTVLTGDAAEPRKPELPAYFHTPSDPFAVAAAPVRTLPPDSGVRTLPVVHLYAPAQDRIPLAVEVGFTQGEASVWYPAVDRRIPADEANGPEAAAQRAWLLDQRAKLQPMGPREDLGADPTRQLHWSALALSPEPGGRPVPTDVPWVRDARALDHALWVDQGTQSERFLFYEADTVERSAVTLRVDGDRFALTNTSERPVHDVWVVHGGRSAFVPGIGPGATVRIAGTPADPALRDTLTNRWTDPTPLPLQRDWAHDGCVMMRDPMKPVETASDHRLFPAELALLWSVWEDRLLAKDGSHLVYREDTAALDAVMPVSLYTDMRHDVRWSRLGLVLVENPEVLP